MGPRAAPAARPGLPGRASTRALFSPFAPGSELPASPCGGPSPSAAFGHQPPWAAEGVGGRDAAGRAGGPTVQVASLVGQATLGRMYGDVRVSDLASYFDWRFSVCFQ